MCAQFSCGQNLFLSRANRRISLLPALLLLVPDFGFSTARAQSVYTTPYSITTVAGHPGLIGSNDGIGSAGQFYAPEGLAVDGSGNIFVADTYNNTIRKIAPGGVVSTYAGNSTLSGSNDGTLAHALFYGPCGVAVDTAGNVYVADSGNDTIRKITPAGVVSTLAGTAGTFGTSDGTGSAALFNNPTSLALDSSGDLYVADTYNDTIRKITPDGVVTTVAGTAGTQGSVDGQGLSAQFSFPQGVALDNKGNILVADSFNNTIRKIAPNGVVTTLAGDAGTFGSADGVGSAARFTYPQGTSVDAAGNIYVVDFYNHTVRRIAPDGTVTTLAGTAGTYGSQDGSGVDARFTYPQCTAIGSSGTLYIADTGDNTIRMGTFSSAELHFQNGAILGTLAVSSSFLPGAWQGGGAMGSGWQERAVADINGDGIPDLIFQNGTLLGALILDASGNASSWVGIGAMGAGWQLRGAADINGDGRPELIFQNGTLLGYLTLTSSGQPNAWNGIGEMGAGWQLHAVADLNGDGQPELIFQNGTTLGALEIGTNGLPTNWAGIGAVSAGWTLSYAVDVNGDHQPDLIFQNGTDLGSLEVTTSFQPATWHGIGAMGAGWVLPGDY